mmetsp:Transcript_6778/g.9491  ORF Transcript_6778/g.9491 Transcript_6778/m.9491 type:complete len:370 (-) Transcript_6778:414-1523(-)
MFSSLNCFSRTRPVQALGGEVLVVSPESDECRLLGDARWEDGSGPCSSVSGLLLSSAGAAVEIGDGEGIEIGEFSTLAAWLELPLIQNRGESEITLAGCGPDSRMVLGDDDDLDAAESRRRLDALLEEDEDGGAMVCVKNGELGARRDHLSGFRGCGFFVDDATPGWYHMVAVAKNNETTFWINGRIIGIAKARAPSRSRLRRIGGKSPGSNGPATRVVLDESWRGNLADVRLFDRALNNDDITSLFTSGPLATAAAHAPPLPPKLHRQNRAARARLLEAIDDVDAAQQILSATTMALHANCALHIDVKLLLSAIQNASTSLADAIDKTRSQFHLHTDNTKTNGDTLNPPLEKQHTVEQEDGHTQITTS